MHANTIRRTVVAGAATLASLGLGTVARADPPPPAAKQDFVATCGSGRFGQLGLGNEKDQ